MQMYVLANLRLQRSSFFCVSLISDGCVFPLNSRQRSAIVASPVTYGQHLFLSEGCSTSC